ncbi:phosphatase PAP2 family protein [Asanoa sp. WMMD1127]|uniref:phosphatase PAP2 family protein n=1 Tax=Asanoa sp. WMMD1127 TaxID=3016107 RepID=UPI0024162D6E|nr:phosphatase PAP2 family protein [Asanoa sp. WMMD1127]MDG4824753.1 phosphatase PAP2 family protein [Asanoa sp. WMMD1127]
MRERRWRSAAAWFAAFAVFTTLLAGGAFLDLDVAVRDWSDAHRPESAFHVAKALYFLGSANLIAAILLVAAVLLGLRDRTVRPALLVVGTAAVSYAVVVPLKIWTDRSAPHAPWPRAVDLFAHDAGWSYPSGHVVNTLIWYPVLLLLVELTLRRTLPAGIRRAVLLGPVLIVFAAVTYLGYHWVTDCVAGVFLGAALRGLLPLDDARGQLRKPSDARFRPRQLIR